MHGCPVESHAPAAVGVHPHRTDGCVSVLDVDVLDRQTEDVGSHLSHGRLVPLAVRRTTDDHRRLPGEVQPDHRHAPERHPGRRLGGGRGSQPADLDIGRKADPEIGPLLAFLSLLLAQLAVPDHFQCLAQGQLVVA